MDEPGDPYREPPGLDGRGAGLGRPPIRPRRAQRSGGGASNRRITIVVAIFLVVLLFGSGTIEFWTDAIWFKSVGFDSVFWTRVWATVEIGRASCRERV